MNFSIYGVHFDVSKKYMYVYICDNICTYSSLNIYTDVHAYMHA